MNLNIALQKEQQQSVQDNLLVVQKQKQEERLNTDIYSLGYFEGIIGLEPSQPEQHSYWSGYQIGSREYWAKKLSVVIPAQF